MLPDKPLADKGLERSLLGALMALSEAGDDESTKRAIAIVRTRDFFTDEHKLVFRTILALDKRGLHFGMEAVCSSLERGGKLNGSLSHRDLVEMRNEIILPIIPTEQAIQVRALGEYRELRQAAYDFSNFVETNSDPTQGRARLKELHATLERTALLTTTPTQTFRELMATEYPGTVPVLDPLIMAGDSMLIVGHSKAGKSVFALQLALALAAGGTALDGIPVPQVRDVLFLNLDDRPKRIKERSELMLASFPDGVYPERLEFAHHWPPMDQGGEGMLHTWAEKHPDGVIIIDLLEKIRPARGGNIYQADYAAVGAITDVAHTHGVTTLTLHHANKSGLAPGSEFNADYSVSGSEAIRGAADGHIVFHPMNADVPGQRLITVKTRDTPGDQYQLEWDEFLHGWRWGGVSAGSIVKDRGPSAQRQAIMNTIQEAGRPLTPKEIAERIGKAPNAVYFLLFQMKKTPLTDVRTGKTTGTMQIIDMRDGTYQHPAEYARAKPTE